MLLAERELDRDEEERARLCDERLEEDVDVLDGWRPRYEAAGVSERSRSRCLPLPLAEEGAELLCWRLLGWSDMVRGGWERGALAVSRRRYLSHIGVDGGMAVVHRRAPRRGRSDCLDRVADLRDPRSAQSAVNLAD